jgi:cell division transport system permease protein
VALCGLALAVPVFALTVAQAVGPAIAGLPAAEVAAFVAPGTPAAELKSLAARVEAIEGVRRAFVVPREAALAELQQRTAGAVSLTDLRPNPLPDVLVAHFTPATSPAAVDAAVAAMRKLPRVDSVHAELDWYRRLVAIADLVRRLGLIAGGVLVVLIVAVIVGTIRSLVRAAPAELELLALLGATDDFIRRQHIYAGATLAGLGAAVALALVAAVHAVINPALADVTRGLGLELALRFPDWPVVLAVVAAGLLLGGAAGGVAISSRNDLMLRPAPDGQPH